MGHLYSYFVQKDIAHLKEMLKNCEQLTLDGKKELHKVLVDKFERSEFKPENLAVLENLIRKEEDELEDTNYLQRSGIELFDENNTLSIRQSRANEKLNKNILIAMPLALLALINLIVYSSFAFEWSQYFTFILINTFLIILSICIVILIKTISRFYFFKGFSIDKVQNMISFSYRHKTKLEKVDFGEDAKINLYVNPENAILTVEDRTKAYEAVKFTHLDYKTLVSLNNMLAKFNKV